MSKYDVKGQLGDPVQSTRERFSDRVADYVCARPSYPPLLDVLRSIGLCPPARIADIGAGTGLSSLRLFEAGFDVVALVWCSVIKLNNISDGFRRQARRDEGESRWLSRHAASRLERPAAAPPGRTT